MFSPRSTDVDVVIAYRRVALVQSVVVFPLGAAFAVTAATVAGARASQVIAGPLGVFMLLLAGDTLYWMIRGLLTNRPLLIGREGFSLTFLGELFVPWGEVVDKRRGNARRLAEGWPGRLSAAWRLSVAVAPR